LEPGANKRYELNEANWWANWTNSVWLTRKAYLMRSRQLDEPFFNRVGFVAPESRWSETVSEAESMFRAGHIRPCFFVQDTEEFTDVREELLSRGYTVSDTMSVMEKERSLHFKPKTAIEMTTKGGVEEWCRAYLLSFYGNTRLLDPTLRIMQRVVKLEEATVVSARYRGATVGTLIMYRRGSTTGVYCVGVVPRYRASGIAASMMGFAHESSRATGSELILQTMLSDGSEGFYAKMGFSRCYSKSVFLKSVRQPTRLA
jgi:N-acetylglutamate synthase-like GNAT family acetyltransferase